MDFANMDFTFTPYRPPIDDACESFRHYITQLIVDSREPLPEREDVGM